MKTDLENIYLAAYEKDKDKELDVDVCLLNLSDRPQVVEVMQGSYEGDIDSFMDLGHSNYKTITLPAKGFHKIDHFDDEGQLDFTTWYTIRADGREFLEHFNGWSLLRDGSADIPAPRFHMPVLEGMAAAIADHQAAIADHQEVGQQQPKLSNPEQV